MKNQHFTIFTHRIITAILSGLLIFTCFVLAQERDAFKKNSLELIEEQNKNEELLIENMELNKELQLQNTLLSEKEQVNQNLLIELEELKIKPTPKPTVEQNSPSDSDSNNLKSTGTYELTAYCNCELCCGQWAGGPTASGVMPTANHTVASNSLPFGTKLNIRGTIYTVEDTGGMADNVIDIYFNSHQEALNFGRQTAEVFVVE